jgi:hypothetical protein
MGRLGFEWIHAINTPEFNGGSSIAYVIHNRTPATMDLDDEPSICYLQMVLVNAMQSDTPVPRAF